MAFPINRSAGPAFCTRQNNNLSSPLARGSQGPVLITSLDLGLWFCQGRALGALCHVVPVQKLTIHPARGDFATLNTAEQAQRQGGWGCMGVSGKKCVESQSFPTWHVLQMCWSIETCSLRIIGASGWAALTQKKGVISAVIFHHFPISCPLVCSYKQCHSLVCSPNY